MVYIYTYILAGFSCACIQICIVYIYSENNNETKNID